MSLSRVTKKYVPMKRPSNMLFLTLFCLFLTNCTPKEPLPIEETTPAFLKSDVVKAYEMGVEGQNYALVGDTTLPKKTTPLHPFPIQNANVNTLKSSNGSFRYVAIGASLTAGVRDGGWFNDGIATAYPNLIARQMGISDFQQPYFKEDEYNGYGVKLPTKNTETPVPRYKAVGNNLAFKPNGVEMILTPYEGTTLNNFAVPNLTNGGLNSDLSTNTFDNKHYKTTLKRIAQSQSIIEQIKNTNTTFFSIEYYLQDLIRYAMSSGIEQNHLPQINYPPFNFGEYTGATDLYIGDLKEKGITNGLMLNVPNLLNFPYFKNSLRFSQIKAIFDKHKLTNKDYGYDGSDTDFIFITPLIDSLFAKSDNRDLFLEYYLKKVKLVGLLENQQKTIRQKELSYNEHIDYVSKKHTIPIVDIKTFYEQISNGTYIADDGRKVTDKEFFSSDGLYPSAYGQALIANECIKTINSFYKTTIPLIKTDYYLN
jgi:lysophospholipase L1-like esterase